jgi:iron(III) transport system ATP-binding protein
MAPFLVLDGLAKSFGPARVLRGLSLAVERGEVLALLGPSGSGKTTALRLIAGFETPDAGCPGRILIEGEDVTGLPPARRGIGMVFQHFALFPHLTVGENVAFGLRGDRATIARRVAEVLALVDLPGFERRGVGELSGGQQQRVALARALAPEPRLLLLDEPLSNLDPTLRERTRRELKKGLRKVGITTVLVTHEQEEAFDVADRVAVLEGGELHQVGRPEELYERPVTRFVASFVGRASTLGGSFVPPGKVRLSSEAATAGASGAVVISGAAGTSGGSSAADTAVDWEGAPIGELAAGQPVVLVLRPESLRLVPPGTPDSLSGRVAERRFAGPLTYYLVALDAPAEPGTSLAEVEVLAGARAAAVGDQVAVAPGGGGPAPCIFAAEAR